MSKYAELIKNTNCVHKNYSDIIDSGCDISKEPIYANVNTNKQSSPIQVQDLLEYIRNNKENECVGFKKELKTLIVSTKIILCF
jgi:hypothetical protein